MKNILALIDFSDITPKVVEHAHAMAQAFGGEIILMHVVLPEPLVVDFEPPAPPENVFDDRLRQLHALRDSLAGSGVKVTTHQFGGAVPETILTQLNKLRPDAIVLGSHGHGALYSLLVGSVTAAVIKNAVQPVLVVPSDPARQTQPASDASAAEEPAELGVLGKAPAPL